MALSGSPQNQSYSPKKIQSALWRTKFFSTQSGLENRVWSVKQEYALSENATIGIITPDNRQE